ncbi:uncharacterized protein P174DRAFT_486997 [Aspergillus novofumigatus IBT 16806]|uniref:SNF2 N-terminal domain-containing protein n=1 Tax=Aspergillus novofumigatus (strain IBT 16806) TaxID=1392255 RepID=A0A2I1CAI5_ASPN1|nr:uncharacterized protein P174DRAFT_486997 [Aspergillus novofumigatus IBT 16806]PKX94637.1 hypothetical protein P174DRAFT_486997 [Aspergillus novofumigatus IBT 16806]
MAKRNHDVGIAKGRGKQRITPASIALIIFQNRVRAQALILIKPEDHEAGGPYPTSPVRLNRWVPGKIAICSSGSTGVCPRSNLLDTLVLIRRDDNWTPALRIIYEGWTCSIGQWIGEIITMTDRVKPWVYYGDYRASAGHNAHIINGKLTLLIRHGPSAAKQWCEKRKLTYDPSRSPHGWDGCLSQLFSMAVFDEAHLLPNKDSRISITAKWMNASFSLLLTATSCFDGVVIFASRIKEAERLETVFAETQHSAPVIDCQETSMERHSHIQEFKTPATRSWVRLSPKPLWASFGNSPS